MFDRAKHLLSPKQVANAIGTSESSLKRWCDRGLLPYVLTAGGHRKLPVHGVLAFLRESRMTLVAPEVLGLPSRTGVGSGVVERSISIFAEQIAAGDEEACRRIVFDLYLAGVSVARIADELIAPTFSRLGDLWDCGELDVYQERRACEICRRIISEWRNLLSPPKEQGPLAIGGTLAGDHYENPSQLADLVLRSNGWRSQLLGCNLPLETIRKAIEQLHPQLLWLSISTIQDTPDLIDQLSDFSASLPADVRLVLGGRALCAQARARLSRAVICDRMQDLEQITKERVTGEES